MTYLLLERILLSVSHSFFLHSQKEKKIENRDSLPRKFKSVSANNPSQFGMCPCVPAFIHSSLECALSFTHSSLGWVPVSLPSAVTTGSLAVCFGSVLSTPPSLWVTQSRLPAAARVGLFSTNEEGEVWSDSREERTERFSGSRPHS